MRTEAWVRSSADLQTHESAPSSVTRAGRTRPHGVGYPRFPSAPVRSLGVRPDQFDVRHLTGRQGEVRRRRARYPGGATRVGGAAADNRVAARRQRNSEVARRSDMAFERERRRRIKIDDDRSRRRMKRVRFRTALVAELPGEDSLCAGGVRSPDRRSREGDYCETAGGQGQGQAGQSKHGFSLRAGSRVGVALPSRRAIRSIHPCTNRATWTAGGASETFVILRTSPRSVVCTSNSAGACVTQSV